MSTKQLLIFLFLLGLVVISILYWKIDGSESRAKLTAYISMLAIIGTFVLLLSYIEGTNNSARNEKKDMVMINNEADNRAVVDLEKLFMSNTPDLLRLYKQLNPENVAIRQIVDPPLTSQILEKEQHMLSIIMQQIETILYPVSNKTISPTSPLFEPWIRTFKTWFSSPLLQQYWATHKHLFTNFTREFIDTQILNGSLQS